MHLSRRNFIKNSAVLAAGAVYCSKTSLFAAAPQKQVVGLQLYSVRDDMKQNPADTLKQLSAMGYVYVEHAGYQDRKFYGYPAAEFKKLLDGLGLKMVSGHTVMTAHHWDNAKNDFTDEWKNTIEDAATAGQRYVISPWLDESLRTDTDALKRFMQQFNKCGELCRQHGMSFGYHNHNFEFNTMVEGETLYDFILKNTDPSLVKQQIDMGNMIGGGGQPLTFLKKYPGRFELMHVKDEIKATNKGEMGDGYESTVLGKGMMNVKEVLAIAKKTGGTTQFIIEQESYQDSTPLESVKNDLQMMKNWDINKNV